MTNSTEISREDIIAAEYVLQYCADSKGMSFNKSDLMDVLSKTTNVLRYFFNMPIRSLRLNVRQKDCLYLDELTGRVYIIKGEKLDDFYRDSHTAFFSSMLYIREARKDDERFYAFY